MLVSQIEDGNQHEQGTHQCIEEELHCCVNSIIPTPNPDEEVHGNQHRFPENIEKENIKSDKSSEHSCLQHQKHKIIFSKARFDRRKRAKNRNRHQKSREQNQPETQSVYAERIENPYTG